MKQRKRQLSEHHFSNSSIIFPSQEIRGCAAIRNENTSRRFIIHAGTWELGTLFTLDPAETPGLPMTHSLTPAAGCSSVITEQYTTSSLQSHLPQCCGVGTCKEASSFLCPLLITLQTSPNFSQNKKNVENKVFQFFSIL